MLAWLLSRDFHKSQTKPSSCGGANASRGGSVNVASSFHAPAGGKAPRPCPHLLLTALLLLGWAVARPAAAATAAAVWAAGKLPTAVAVAVAEEPARFAEDVAEVTAAYAL